MQKDVPSFLLILGDHFEFIFEYHRGRLTLSRKGFFRHVSEVLNFAFIQIYIYNLSESIREGDYKLRKGCI